MESIFSFISEAWPLILIFVVTVVYVFSGIHVVSEWDRVPVMRFGKYIRTLGPGISWVEPITNSTLDAVDIRQEVQSFEMDEGASLQTHDNVPISFVTIITTQIDAENVKKFTVAVTDGDDALEMRTLATVSEIVSATMLNQLLHERAAVCDKIHSLVQQRVRLWGIQIVAVELRDVKITDETIQEAIALKARAGKEAEAEMVRAEAQVAISKELSLASKELSEGGWKLKQLEVMLEMTRSAENNTVIIPSDAVAAMSGIAAMIPRKVA